LRSWTGQQNPFASTLALPCDFIILPMFVRGEQWFHPPAWFSHPQSLPLFFFFWWWDWDLNSGPQSLWIHIRSARNLLPSQG
jgi:hypothetical protein